MLSQQDKKVLEAFAGMLPLVAEIVKRCLNTDAGASIGEESKAAAIKEDDRQAGLAARRLKFWYNNNWYSQNQLVHQVLKDLAKSKTETELRTMFPSKAILGTDNWQQRILITPEDYDKLSAGYIGRYNTDDPIVTKDGVKLYVWTNWGLFKTTYKGERLEDATPKFIRTAKQHGIEIRMPEL